MSRDGRKIQRRMHAITHKKLLVAPLNWGLGHSTRCIPIINALLARGHEVHIASDGAALALLRKEFPHLPWVKLSGYHVKYSGPNLLFSMALQSPRIALAVIREGRQTRNYVRSQSIDIVISDNRLGCYDPTVKNIFITHQLRLLLRPSWLSKLASWFNRSWINRFDAIWIPDEPSSDRVTKAMTSLNGIKKPVSFLGVLSRMKPMQLDPVHDVIIILSGPEPSRTLLENKIIQQCQILPYNILLVRGLPGSTEEPINLPPHISTVNSLTSEHLNTAICSSKYIVSRTGYTTVMDLIKLGRDALLIPTPGQPEQEHLGAILNQMGRFYVVEEKHLDLSQLVPVLEQRSVQPFTSIEVKDRLTSVLDLEKL